MSDNQKKILEMLAENKIGVDEAFKLLSVLPKEEGSEPRQTAGGSKFPFKYLRVNVKSAEGNNGKPDHVNIRVPISLIRAGMKLTSLIPSQTYDKVDTALKEKGIDFDLRNMKPEDLEELVTAINDLEVDIENGKETVRVYVE